MYPGDEEVKLEQIQRKKALKDGLPVVNPAREVALAEPAESVDDVDTGLPNIYLTEAWDTTYHHRFIGDYLFLTLDSGMFLDVQVDALLFLEHHSIAFLCLFSCRVIKRFGFLNFSNPGMQHTTRLCVLTATSHDKVTSWRSIMSPCGQVTRSVLDPLLLW